MLAKFLLVSFVLLLQHESISCQREWVPSTATASEMRNPYTWYWPYAIAASEAYRDYFVNAQKITSQLHQQAEATGAVPYWAAGSAYNTANGAANGAYGPYSPYGRFRG